MHEDSARHRHEIEPIAVAARIYVCTHGGRRFQETVEIDKDKPCSP